jgi:hypothetical protein
MAPMTPAARRALVAASKRERGTVCPIRGVHGIAEEMLLGALERRGFVDHNNGVPLITDAGRAALAPTASTPSR